MRISSVCPRMRPTLLGTNLEAIPRESLGQLRLPRPKDLEDFWAGEAMASGKLVLINSTMALTVAGMGASSASFSSLEWEAGRGEDREWGLSCEGSREKARDEWRGGGETESLAS